MFGTFLRAQATSPTLSLAYANIGDEGALEIAHFLAISHHVTRLDLSGNAISSYGLTHLAKAIKQNQTLESLVLKHNKIGEDGESGVASLCAALRGNGKLRHLDLKRNGISGVLAATCLGELMLSNDYLTHLELSWNSIDVAGGQVLLEHVQRNTSLFDCQLTGCGIAEETLLGIAQLLLRNRKAKGADKQAGPYDARIDPGLGGGPVTRGLGGNPLERSLGDFTRRAAPVARGAEGFALDPEEVEAELSIFPGQPPGVRVSDDKTNELMMRLLKWQSAPGLSREAVAHAQELYEYMERAQKQLVWDKKATEDMRNHQNCLAQGFRDRERRYREDITVAKDKLADYHNERQGLKAIFDRYAEETKLLREQTGQVCQAIDIDRHRYDAEESRATCDLQIAHAEVEETRRRLRLLQEESEQMQKENDRLRSNSGRVREDIILLHAF